MQMKISIFFGLLILFSSAVFSQKNSENELISAIYSQNIDALEKHIDSANINIPLSNQKGNVLIQAIESNSPKVVQYLLEKKADPNYSYNSRTPLMYAAQKQNICIIRQLLKYGAAINEKDSIGNTALMIASTGSKLNIVKLMIRRGASLNHRNKKGLNARDFAVRSHNKAIAAYLKNIFERNLPNYSDGPYVNFVSRKKIKVSYLKHDSLRRRTEAFHEYSNIKHLNNQFCGIEGDTSLYPLTRNFEKPPTEISNVKKLLVIGDVHGQYDTLKVFLQNNKVIDNNLKWTFGDGTVVFIGDIFDRGEKVTEAMWLIYRMEKEAPKHGGMVQLILGNHEMMVLQEDERYIAEKYYYLFKNVKLSYSNYYSNKTLLGRWLRSKNTFLKADSLLFVHGGIHPNILQYKLSLDSINNLISSYLSAKRKTNYANNFALQFLLSYNGPFWYRGMVEESEGNKMSEQDMNQILTSYNSKYVIVGHTFKPRINTYCYGKVIATDVPFYLPDGYPMQALLLEDRKFVLLNSKGERKEFVLQ